MARKNIAITLYMDELVYDIQNKTYLTGESRKSGDNFEQVAQMKANDDDESLNQVLRSIGSAVSSLRGLLGEYLESGAGEGERCDNTLHSKDTDITINLSVPSNFNTAVSGAVSDGIHKYVVSYAIGDWFSITNKADAQDYYTTAAGTMTEIRNAISKRTRPVRGGETQGGETQD